MEMTTSIFFFVVQSLTETGADLIAETGSGFYVRVSLEFAEIVVVKRDQLFGFDIAGTFTPVVAMHIRRRFFVGRIGHLNHSRAAACGSG